MAVGDLPVFLAHIRHVARLLLRRQQRRDHAHRPAGIGHIDRLTLAIARMDLHRGMHPAGRCPADQQRNVEALALHLGGHMRHLVK